jgi:hypothetical protein
MAPSLTAVALCSAAALVGCGGKSLSGGKPDGGGLGDGGAAGTTDVSHGGFDGPLPGLDPGRVAIHRLNNLEYDNTIRDLLGIDNQLARMTFQPDEKGDFDNNAEAFTINDARYEQYFNAAESLAEAAMASPALRGRIVSCTTTADRACVEQIVRTFGARAWRRPLTDAEVGRFVSLAQELTAAGRMGDEVVTVVVQGMLSSASFIYRIEWDPDPASLAPHAVSPYELASRLSYWLWSTMPDAELFGLAETGQLAKPEVLVAQVRRMLDDARSDNLVESFGGQWLWARELKGHSVEPTAFHEFDEELRAAMADEQRLFFSTFLHEARPLRELPNADLNFVNARLAKHYGMDATGLGDLPVKVTNTADARKGYLGLAGLLTTTSFSHRTDPRTRARWIFRSLLCTELPLPPEAHWGPTPEAVSMATTIRGQIDAIFSAGPSCSTCHRLFEPDGLALESFDAIGRFRTVDDRGAPIATQLADGTPILDEQQLADRIAADPRFLSCAGQMALIYALGRQLVASDEPYLKELLTAWSESGGTLRALLESIVVSDTFRFRRGERP